MRRRHGEEISLYGNPAVAFTFRGFTRGDVMNHGRWKEMLQLSLFNEITEEEKRLLKEHLEGCEDCRTEMEKLSKLRQMMTDYSPPAADASLLREARENLGRAIRSAPVKLSLRDRFLDYFYQLNRPAYKVAFAASASFLIGIVIAYYIFHSPVRLAVPQETAAQAVALPGETRITNVRFLDVNDGTGQLDFTFDAVRPVHIKGDIHDEQIQKILTYAILNGDNPGIRLRSVNAVAGHLTADKEIKTALIAAVKSDLNAGVRKESMRALQNFPLDDDIKKALLFVLNHDKNPGLRITAINLLDSLRTSNLIPDKDLLDVFKNTIQHDDNNYIRLRAKAALEEIKQ